LRWQNPPEDVEWIFFEAQDAKDFTVGLKGISQHLVKPLQGGLVEGRVILDLPSGKALYGLSFRGTLDRWRNGVISYCETTGRMTAHVRGRKLVLSTGEQVNFEDVRARDY